MVIIAEGMEAWRNVYFRGIRRHWMLIHLRAKKRTKYDCATTTPLLHSSCLQ